MRSIFGECTGNVRSTPTPNDCLRTVKVSRTPWPWRLMTTPSKTWVRRRVPSITWKWTRTRSPEAKVGTRRSWERSRVSITVLMTEAPATGRTPARAAHGSEGVWGLPSGGRAALAAARAAPRPDLGVVSRQQDLGDAPAPVLRRTRVVRVLGIAAQRLAEGLLDRGLRMAERTGQLAQDRVADDHRRQLAAREHVAADRDLVRAEVVDDPLVEALVAP